MFLSVCVVVSVCLSVCLSFCLSFCLCLSVCVCLHTCLSVFLSVCMSACLSVCPFTGLSVDWSGFLRPLCLSVFLSHLTHTHSPLRRTTDKIKDLAVSVSQLFTQVLERLEQDHGAALIRFVLSLFVCVRSGVRDMDIQNLLREKARKTAANKIGE
jgi:hypothetical protein